MFYRIDKNNNIIDNANFKYADDCLQTEKNIVRGFDGQLYFEEELQSAKYLMRKSSHEVTVQNENRIAEIEARLDALDKDFRQADLGAVIKDLDERKAEFIALHNELRTLQGKPLREYIKKEV